MSVQSSLNGHLDAKKFVVLWSSDDNEHIKTYGCIVQFIGSFNDKLAKPVHFKSGYLVAVDEETGKVRFATGIITTDWEEFCEYIYRVHHKPAIVEAFARKFKNRTNNKWEMWKKGNALGKLYYKSGKQLTLKPLLVD